MNPLSWNEYARLFDSLGSTVWLNHAGVAPISRPVAESMEHHIRDVLENGALHVVEWHSRLKKIKENASRLLNCRPRDLAVTPNTTHGVNLVAGGLDWKEGDEILLCTKEYPANVYPWWAQRSKGVRLVWVKPEKDGRLPVEAYLAKVTDRTRVLTVSHVQFASGYRHDLKRLGELCREAGILFFVDAIQSFSVFEIDVEGWGIDALTTGSHKWLLGPTGVALFYTTAETRDRLETTYVGADCMVDALNYLEYRYELQPDGRRFENAMLNFPGIAGLEAALEVVERVGRDRLEEKIFETTSRLLTRLREMGFIVHSSRAEGEWSGILSVTHPKRPAGEIRKALLEHGIVTSIRDGRLRVSPHAYHSPAVLEQVAAVFERVVRDERG